MRNYFLMFSLMFFALVVSIEIFLVGLYQLTPIVKNKGLKSIVASYYFNYGRKLEQFYCGKYDSELFYLYKEGSCSVQNLEFLTKINGNSFGVRDSEEKLKQNPRIAFVGDSHTSGWGIKYGERFSDLVSKNTNIETINLGVSSYGTVRALKIFERYLKLNPNIEYLVIQYEGNDNNENMFYQKDGNILNVSDSNKYSKAKKWNIKKSTYSLGDANVYFFKTARDRIKIKLKESWGIEIGKMPYVPSKKESSIEYIQKKLSRDIDYFHNVLKNHSELLIDKKVIVFGLGMTNGWYEKLLDKVERDKLPFKLTIFNAYEFLNSDDFFYLDGHINQSGHQKISSKLVSLIGHLKD